ncbi:hypothetical protein V1264_004198 [Littorina saxatilis]|uniref:Uncharacterized protein n=1 Tax=Littorina saxatilis TaxID=31220 RepID=A0AAN9B1X2_9CAEN
MLLLRYILFCSIISLAELRIRGRVSEARSRLRHGGFFSMWSHERANHSDDRHSDEEKLRESLEVLDKKIEAYGLGLLALFVLCVSIAWFCCSSHKGSIFRRLH